MIQQINLYQSVLAPKRDPLSARNLLLGVALACLLLLLVYGHGLWRQQQLEKTLASLQEQTRAAMTQIAELEEQFPLKGKSRLVQDEIQRLQTEREAKLPLLQRVNTRIGGNTSGFSAHLKGLARQSLDGLWLRRLAAAGGGERWTLEGSALRPELVPRYLQRIAREEGFSGVEFSRFHLQRSQIRPDAIDFVVESTGGTAR